MPLPFRTPPFRTPGCLRPLALVLGLLTALPPLQAQTLEVVAQGLQSPWAMAALPEGGWLVSERPGALRVVAPDGRVGPPLSGLPGVDAVGQGGLHDVVLDRDFARNRQLYFCFAEPGQGAEAGRNGTALARARLRADRQGLEAVDVVFRQQPKMEGRHHFGCRIVEAPDGTLFLTLGERFTGMQRAQTLDNHLGKVVRVHKDGRVPADNPFVRTPGALPEIYSYGHRNPQGAALDARGQLWVHEHGPQGGDELNRVLPGRNYGWPVVTYGENYGGGAIGEGREKPGMEAPVLTWVPSIAPSGLAILNSAAYGPAWQGQFFLGALKFRFLERVGLPRDGATQLINRPSHTALTTPQLADRLAADVGRVRDVRQGPDGLLYLLVEGDNGQLLRLKP